MFAEQDIYRRIFSSGINFIRFILFKKAKEKNYYSTKIKTDDRKK